MHEKHVLLYDAWWFQMVKIVYWQVEMVDKVVIVQTGYCFICETLKAIVMVVCKISVFAYNLWGIYCWAK